MNRRLSGLGAFAAISAVLLIAGAAMWVSSYYAGDWLPVWRSDKRHIYIGSGSGSIIVKRHAITSPAEGIRFVRQAAQLPNHGPVNTVGVTIDPNGGPALIIGHRPLLPCWWYRIEWADNQDMIAGVQSRPSVLVRTRADELAVGYLLPLLLLSVGPALWLVRRRRLRSRMHAQRCFTCGYDLRATPDRCPECGAIPAAGAQSNDMPPT